jgi:hypothetical protein
MLTLATLNWEAVATFATGLAAVTGAIVVGYRQTAIQSRQVELEKLKIRSDLFDKRFATYEATADFLTHINVYMNDPERKKLGDWLLKLREAQFLFNPPVHDELGEIFKKATAYRISCINLEQGVHPNLNRIANEQMDLMRWLAERLTTVHKIFEADLNLRHIDK